MTHGRIFIVTLAALLALSSACGGDDDSSGGSSGSGGKGKDAGQSPENDAGPSGGGSGGGDKDASTSGGGKGGSTGGGGTGARDSGTSDEDGGTPTIEQCGAVSCEQPECCADPFVSRCGLQVNARACLPPQMSTSMSDSRCPSVAVMGGAFMIPSCCTDDGRCGINAQAAGMGCIALETVIMYTMSQGGAGSGIMWPEPKTCD